MVISSTGDQNISANVYKKIEGKDKKKGINEKEFKGAVKSDKSGELFKSHAGKDHVMDQKEWDQFVKNTQDYVEISAAEETYIIEDGKLKSETIVLREAEAVKQKWGEIADLLGNPDVNIDKLIEAAKDGLIHSEAEDLGFEVSEEFWDMVIGNQTGKTTKYDKLTLENFYQGEVVKKDGKVIGRKASTKDLLLQGVAGMSGMSLENVKKAPKNLIAAFVTHYRLSKNIQAADQRYVCQGAINRLKFSDPQKYQKLIDDKIIDKDGRIIDEGKLSKDHPDIVSQSLARLYQLARQLRAKGDEKLLTEVFEKMREYDAKIAKAKGDEKTELMKEKGALGRKFADEFSCYTLTGQYRADSIIKHFSAWKLIGNIFTGFIPWMVSGLSGDHFYSQPDGYAEFLGKAAEKTMSSDKQKILTATVSKKVKVSSDKKGDFISVADAKTAGFKPKGKYTGKIYLSDITEAMNNMDAKAQKGKVSTYKTTKELVKFLGLGK